MNKLAEFYCSAQTHARGAHTFIIILNLINIFIFKSISQALHWFSILLYYHDYCSRFFFQYNIIKPNKII